LLAEYYFQPITKEPMTHIVLVDDDRTNSNLIKMWLEMDNFQVTVCNSLSNAKSEAGKADLFVVDFHLGRNEYGIDFLTDVREAKTEADAATPIIITSGDHRQEKVVLEKGANCFMLKPYPPSELSSTIKELI